MGASCGCISVPEDQITIVERFGRFQEALFPGLHCINCCTSNVRGSLSTRVREVDLRIEAKTKDNIFVMVKVSVQYKMMSAVGRRGSGYSGPAIEKAPLMLDDPVDAHYDEDVFYRAFYKLTDVQQQVTRYVEDSIRSTVPDILMDGLFSSKEKIAKSVQDTLNKEMRQYGYEVVKVLLIDLEPDSRVKAAMNEANAAERLRAATVSQAEAQKTARILKAESEATARIKEAEADAECRHLAGRGIANARRAIVAGLQDSVVAFKHDVAGASASEVMQFILNTQYYDTLKDVAAHSKHSVILLPPGAAGGPSVSSTGQLDQIADAVQRGSMVASLATTTLEK